MKSNHIYCGDAVQILKDFPKSKIFVDEILSQLGNKIQHTLRCYTPSDEKKVKAASNSFRKNQKLYKV